MKTYQIMFFFKIHVDVRWKWQPHIAGDSNNLYSVIYVAINFKKSLLNSFLEHKWCRSKLKCSDKDEIKNYLVPIHWFYALWIYTGITCTSTSHIGILERNFENELNTCIKLYNYIILRKYNCFQQPFRFDIVKLSISEKRSPLRFYALLKLRNYYDHYYVYKWTET